FACGRRSRPSSRTRFPTAAVRRVGTALLRLRPRRASFRHRRVSRNATIFSTSSRVKPRLGIPVPSLGRIGFIAGGSFTHLFKLSGVFSNIAPAKVSRDWRWVRYGPTRAKLFHAIARVGWRAGQPRYAV